MKHLVERIFARARLKLDDIFEQEKQHRLSLDDSFQRAMSLVEELHSINEEIIERLKEQGVSKYLYENEEYLEEIRRGTIICKGINIDEIKKMIWG